MRTMPWKAMLLSAALAVLLAVAVYYLSGPHWAVLATGVLMYFIARIWIAVT